MIESPNNHYFFTLPSLENEKISSPSLFAPIYIAIETIASFGSKLVQNFEIPEKLKNATVWIIGNVGSAINSGYFVNLIYKTYQYYENKKAKESNDPVKLLETHLEKVSLVGEYFWFATLAFDFAQKFFQPATLAAKITLTLSKVCTAAAALFSFAEAIRHGLHYRTTQRFSIELKREKHFAFIKAYMNQPNQSMDSINGLSNKELHQQVKAIKNTLRTTDQKTLLSKIIHCANQAFILALTQKMTTDPEIVSAHLAIEINEKEEKSPHFFEKWLPKIPSLPSDFKNKLIQASKSADDEKVSKIAKLLKNRIHYIKNTHIFSMIVAGLESVNAITTFALGIINPLLAPIVMPIGAGITACTSLMGAAKYGIHFRMSKTFVNTLKNALY